MHDERLSVSRACQVARLSRAAYYRKGIDWGERDRPVVEALNRVVERHGRWGFWKCHDRLRLEGHLWNPKRTYRVYCAMKLNLPRRTKRRLPARLRQPLTVAAAVNQVWSLDFMSDCLYDGRRFRTLNVLDEGVREALGIEIDTSLPAKRVVRVLERLVDWRGAPPCHRVCHLVRAPRHRAAIHPAGQARSERIHRAVQSQLPGGSARRLRLRRSARGASDHPRMAQGLQRRATPRCAGKPAASAIP
jgi:transposase InsO family protein